ncbi:hypothetical protein VPH35_013517 [Triticum aestivum]
MAAQQPGGLPEHQARALSAAYTGVCAAKEPVQTPGDLARLTGVGGWVVDVMEDSFQGPALICPLREVIHQEKWSSSPSVLSIVSSMETGLLLYLKGYCPFNREEEHMNKPYVPRLKSAAYAIMITLYREMERGKEFMMRQELIDAAEASGLSHHAIGPNNSRNSRNDGYSFTGWNSMKTLTNKDLVEKKSNPAKYYLTEKGKETARDCLLIFVVNALFSDNGHATNSPLSSRGMFGQQSFSAMGSAEMSLLAMPPHQSNESFLKAYEVVLILDDRDTFGPRSRRKVVDNIRSQFNIPVEIKHLPVGDALWIARHKELDNDYVLDFIVERKNVEDLLGSIKDNRYKDQKLRLKLYALLTAPYAFYFSCFTTEVLEGFDVQRTTGYADTEKKYGHLTGSIIDYYSRNFSFVKRCSDLEKVTMSDIFALQLMQVPQLTKEATLAVTSLYPTLLSLAKAYTMLSDRCAQEEMLKNKSDMVNARASKNIFKLIWAEG